MRSLVMLLYDPSMSVFIRLNTNVGHDCLPAVMTWLKSTLCSRASASLSSFVITIVELIICRVVVVVVVVTSLSVSVGSYRPTYRYPPSRPSSSSSCVRRAFRRRRRGRCLLFLSPFPADNLQATIHEVIPLKLERYSCEEEGGGNLSSTSSTTGSSGLERRRPHRLPRPAPSSRLSAA